MCLNPQKEIFRDIKKGIWYVYDTFKQRVADGRGLGLEAVEDIAQGVYGQENKL